MSIFRHDDVTVSGNPRSGVFALPHVAGDFVQRHICIFIILLLLREKLHLSDLDRPRVRQSRGTGVATVVAQTTDEDGGRAREEEQGRDRRGTAVVKLAPRVTS